MQVMYRKKYDAIVDNDLTLSAVAPVDNFGALGTAIYYIDQFGYTQDYRAGSGDMNQNMIKTVQVQCNYLRESNTKLEPFDFAGLGKVELQADGNVVLANSIYAAAIKKVHQQVAQSVAAIQMNALVADVKNITEFTVPKIMTIPSVEVGKQTFLPKVLAIINNLRQTFTRAARGVPRGELLALYNLDIKGLLYAASMVIGSDLTVKKVDNMEDVFMFAGIELRPTKYLGTIIQKESLDKDIKIDTTRLDMIIMYRQAYAFASFIQSQSVRIQPGSDQIIVLAKWACSGTQTTASSAPYPRGVALRPRLMMGIKFKESITDLTTNPITTLAKATEVGEYIKSKIIQPIVDVPSDTNTSTSNSGTITALKEALQMANSPLRANDLSKITFNTKTLSRTAEVDVVATITIPYNDGSSKNYTTTKTISVNMYSRLAKA